MNSSRMSFAAEKGVFTMCEALETQKTEGREEMARDIVSNLFTNGASFELVRLSVPCMSENEILEIRHSVESRGKSERIGYGKNIEKCDTV